MTYRCLGWKLEPRMGHLPIKRILMWSLKNIFVRIKYVESTVSPNTIKDIYQSILVDDLCKRLNLEHVDVAICSLVIFDNCLGKGARVDKFTMLFLW